ncbi:MULTISPECIES: fasciclin domain-containing protein [Rhodococcus]|uniref:Fasciclin domain-containing protein n=1 Tax=Rhodococcus sp. D-6 TaxID=1387842 RepID=A0AAU7UXF3_9NOCA|nr:MULTISPECIES: fasciclin domain-containing protein [Rhodococcus]APE11293.1 fasciclin [Rhodococcus sp. 2G]MBX4168940.1 fasciclin domain-containing protein [Rhodococcus sp. DMU2021]MCD5419455.1 fasciclin domain-containing protein [Rhodococcus pyridinivorans]MCW3468803.1 fasciclin domain-containing protein [Rhodococcus pyridinivorans]OBA32504.1 fasciclin [Rhodococcus sp. 852002-51564_SCH6189132-a]
MNITARKSLAVVGIGAMSLLGVAACSDDSGTDTTDTTTMETTQETMQETTTAATGTAAPAAGPVGPGCADYVAANPTGPSSVEELANQPVAEAAGNVPILTTLTQALSGQLNPDVNLVETLNDGEFTVFAPVDDAFAALPPETVQTLQTDSALLTDILTYHVVPGELTPADIAGTQTTVQGGTVEVAGEGEMWTVNDANVICGGIETENATVYLIDGVLMPQQ